MATTMTQSAITSLIHDLGLNEQEIAQRKKYLDLNESDVQQIKKLRKTLTPHIDEFTTRFFKYLDKSDASRNITHNPATLDHFKQMKKMHLSSLFEGKYDLEYATQRLDLAIAYSRTGIDIKTFLGAFNDMLYNIGTHIMQQKGDSKDHFDNFKSLLKAAALDAGLMMDVFIHQREKVIRHQQETLRELSTPVLQLRTGLLILPIIGMIDTLRARQITESLLQAIRAKRAKIVVMDITGVPAVDSKVANHLLQTFDAAKLMGAHIILTGLSADVAQALVALGIDLARMKTFGELQDGIEEAEYLLSNKYFNLSKSNQRRDPSVSSNT